MNSTIKDIAAKTGLSITTVSLVLNNKKSRISPKTKQLILKTAEDLNYIPNQTAISLVTKESKTFGLIITDISNPFFSELSKGISAKAAEYGFNIILCDTEDSYELTMRYLRILVSQNVDGIIMTLADDIRDEKMAVLSEFMKNHTLPVVLVERTDPLIMSDCVIVNHKSGCYLAAKHLIELGHRNVGCITGPSHLDASKYRLMGVKIAFEENGLEFRQDLVTEGNYHIDSGYKGTQKILETAPEVTAIHAFNDMMAYGAVECLKDKGIIIPDQISVVGFDDIFFSKMLYVPLTSVALPIQKMGEKAVELLTERVLNKELPWRCEILEPKLVIRQSTSGMRTLK
jgi:LacI family transcriptional regulator